MKNLRSDIFTLRRVTVALCVYAVVMCSALATQGAMYAVAVLFFAAYVVCFVKKPVLLHGLNLSQWCMLIFLPVSYLLVDRTLIGFGELFICMPLISAVFLCGRKDSGPSLCTLVVATAVFDILCLCTLIFGIRGEIWGCHIGVDYRDNVTFSGISVHSNQLAALNMCAIFCDVLLLNRTICRHEKKSQRWLLLLLPLFSVCLIMTKSRTVVMSMALAALVPVPYFLITLPRKKKVLALSFCIAAVGTVSILAIVKGIPLLQRTYSPVKQDFVNSFLNSRLNIWKYHIQVWLQSPLLGVGFGRVPDLFCAVAPENYHYVKYYAHNGFVQILSAHGIVMLGLFFWFLGRLFWGVLRRVPRMFRRAYNEKNGETVLLVSLLLTLLFYNLSEGNFLYEIKHVSVCFWLFAGMLEKKNP